MNEAKQKKALPVFHGLTVNKVLENATLRLHIEKLLELEDFELVLPPCRLMMSDEYLGNGDTWHQVSEASHPNMELDYDAFIVRRPSEFKRMVRFFFGKSR